MPRKPRYQTKGFVGKTLLTGAVFAAGVFAQQSCDVSSTVRAWYQEFRAPSPERVARDLDLLPDTTAYRLLRERVVSEPDYRR